MENVKVSVIIPVYKVEKYLIRCINSIIGQTYKNIEIILIDDGSPDRCPIICDEYSKKDERIKVIHKKNGGLSSARNKGVDLSSGEYITFIDSDDFISEFYIEYLLKAVIENNSLMSCCQDIRFGNEKNLYDSLGNKNNKFNYYIMTKNDFFSEMLELNSDLRTAWGKMFHASLFKKYNFDETFYFAEDMKIIHRLVNECNNIVKVNNVLYYYSQESESLVRSKFRYEKLQMLECAYEWKCFIGDNYPSLKSKATDYYFFVLMGMCNELIFVDELRAQKELTNLIKEMKVNKVNVLKNQFMKTYDKLKCFLLINEYLKLYKLIYKFYYLIRRVGV